MVTAFPRARRPFLTFSALPALCSTLAGCGPSYVRLAEDRPAYTREEGRCEGSKLLGAREIDPGPLRQVAESFLGWPYLLGGDGPSGIDCSAFSRQVFRRAFGLELPRKASWQAGMGVPVFKFGLRPGDLVFFGDAPEAIEHVGIYMDNGLFINATSSSGVRYCSLDDAYWTARYQFARRMPDLGPADSTARP
jgi:hypothetical protein